MTCKMVDKVDLLSFSKGLRICLIIKKYLVKKTSNTHKFVNLTSPCFFLKNNSC